MSVTLVRTNIPMPNSRRKPAEQRLTESPTYNVWHNMKKRCQNPADTAYQNYGARGITVCDRWQRFENFRADMGDRPFPRATLERVDSNKNYSPENCLWVDRVTQSNNTRRSVRFEYKGKMYNLRELSELSGMKMKTLSSRIYYLLWPVDRAVETPVMPQRERCNSLPSTTPATRHKLYPQS